MRPPLWRSLYGICTPSLALIAVTDRDRSDTSAEGAAQQVAVLPAVEISATWHGQMAAVLACGIDPQSPAFQLVERVRQGERANAEEMYEALLHRGYHFPKREMQLKATGKQLRGAGDHAALLLAHGCASEWVAVLTRIREVDDREEIKAGLADTVDTAHRSGGWS
ncbi:MAG: hypothetical protein IMW90_17685 [Thermogemmatispora sp.]|uniref:hypothetical protein n=1 Tax=Thermogemmatispora sp. TaxID=1968838 RepID=UPI0019E100B0|nr:hypothetical protein [Thermogemmatispora sp.]MBE3567549.1 hypothetical protein [Thermogemmatispora sp.]